ncbi:uncharacterized protein LOC123530144 isoform X1 [Mercenaria mercenaria]|uniref:uncharacterized protein LOC123530144 isoform X1 n=1 Tax=Mercenaria mercenaria TaxID=6596 RepID=UPI00234F7163|nr:uncharacterized protein LOC123530144 isoform X1 [Mercenaria mercenaria]
MSTGYYVNVEKCVFANHTNMFCTKVYTLLIMIIEGLSVYSSLIRPTNSEIVLTDSITKLSNERTVLRNYLILNKLGGMEIQLKHKRQKRHSTKKNCLGLCKRSLCPWTEVWDIDNDRIPSSIPRAICNSKCHFNFTALISSKILNVFTACEPFKIDYPIFKDNKYTYMKDWPVACVCTKKLSSTVPHIRTKDSHVNRKKLKNHVFNAKSRRHKHHKDKNRRGHNKLQRYKYFKVIPPVLRPFQFLPQYKK